MIKALYCSFLRWNKTVADGVGSAALAFVPAISLSAFWAFGEAALLTVALGLPLIMVLGGYMPAPPARVAIPKPRPLNTLAQAETALEQSVTHFLNGRADGACYIMSISPQPEPYQMAALGSRLKSVVRFGDVVAIQGDTGFVICIEATDNLTDAASLKIANRLQMVAQRPLLAAGKTHKFKATIGFCQTSQAPEATASNLLDAADRALVSAQNEEPGSIVGYNPSFGGKSLLRSLEQEVEDALEQNEIVAWYQPQMDFASGRIIGAEALVRWVHPEHGTIAPQEFLAAIRKAGCWASFTDHMVTSALWSLVHLDRNGIHIDQVSVNFAQEDLEDPSLVDRIENALRSTKCAPERLTIEVLEHVVSANTESQICETLRRLSDLGCAIDLDDFGTGNTSIATLRGLPINRIKIDRSYAKNIDVDSSQRALLETIMLMAKRLKLDTLIEGIETQGQLDTAHDLGCKAVQGYVLARPMPLQDLQSWLSEYQQYHGRKSA